MGTATGKVRLVSLGPDANPRRLEDRFAMRSWPRFRQLLRRLRRPVWLGTLGATRPLSGTWGFDRGTPVDRYYIERFLSEHREAIRGRVLEIKDSSYTREFGAGVVEAEVLDIDASNPNATIVADLGAADAV